VYFFFSICFFLKKKMRACVRFVFGFSFFKIIFTFFKLRNYIYSKINPHSSVDKLHNK
jgi:hypothetical protein